MGSNSGPLDYESEDYGLAIKTGKEITTTKTDHESLTVEHGNFR